MGTEAVGELVNTSSATLLLGVEVPERVTARREPGTTVGIGDDKRRATALGKRVLALVLNLCARIESIAENQARTTLQRLLSSSLCAEIHELEAYNLPVLCYKHRD